MQCSKAGTKSLQKQLMIFTLKLPELWTVPQMATVLPSTSVCSVTVVRPVTPRYVHKHLNNY